MCTHVALRYALTILETQRKRVLCIGIPPLCRLPEALERLEEVLPNPVAVVVRHAKVEHRLRVVRLRGLFLLPELG